MHQLRIRRLLLRIQSNLNIDKYITDPCLKVTKAISRTMMSQGTFMVMISRIFNVIRGRMSVSLKNTILEREMVKIRTV